MEQTKSIIKKYRIAERIALLCSTRPDYERHAKDNSNLGSFFATGDQKTEFVSVKRFFFITEFFDRLLISSVIEPAKIPDETAPIEAKNEFENYLLRIANKTAIEGYLNRFPEIIQNAPDLEYIANLETFLNEKRLKPKPGDQMTLTTPNGNPDAKVTELYRHILIFSPLSQTFVYLKTILPI